MDFDHWLNQAWNEHAEQPAGVAQTLATGQALVGTDAQLQRLAHLAHHLYGEHLRQWDDGRVLLQALGRNELAAPDGPTARALPIYLGSLALAAGSADALSGLAASERVRATAQAAAALAEHDTPRALQHFEQALAEAQQAALPAGDPSTRQLAITGNNLACTLEEKPSRSEAERELMILAAQTARHYWALAGGWLETERAEYRLAMTWLHAGDAAQARVHALACLQIVHDNTGPALERFFAHEAVARVARSQGDAAAHEQALADARTAFDALEPGDQAWCKASLDKLGV